MTKSSVDSTGLHGHNIHKLQQLHGAIMLAGSQVFKECFQHIFESMPSVVVDESQVSVNGNQTVLYLIFWPNNLWINFLT